MDRERRPILDFRTNVYITVAAAFLAALTLILTVMSGAFDFIIEKKPSEPDIISESGGPENEGNEKTPLDEEDETGT